MQELVLHQPPGRPWGTPNLSPFCTKLETYLRVAEIPYRLGKFRRGDAPKGKVPYVRLDGTFVGDSQLIIEELERRLAAEGKQPLDAHLTTRDRALGRLLRRTLEEGTYFVGIYMRWKADAGYPAIRDEFKKFVPSFVVPLIRRSMIKKLHEQGTGRHTLEEATALGMADLESIAQVIGEGPFLFGETPSTVDCTLFAFLEAMLGVPGSSPLKDRALALPGVGPYRQRFRDRWWKDLAAHA